MRTKIRVLFINSKKTKRRKTTRTIEDLIEIETPDTYEFINEDFGCNIVEQIKEHKPEIIFLNDNKSTNIMELIKKIKATDPSIKVFVIISNVIDDEQELIDKYQKAGVYKCYFSTLVLDTLIHDMYVSLNLE